MIKDRLTAVFGKFEEVIIQQGRANVQRDQQELLLEHQREDIQAISEPATGMLRKLEQIKRQNNLIK